MKNGLTIHLRGAALALLMATMPVHAGFFSSEESEFLPVDQAFQPQAITLKNGDIAVTWQIADGYYLYRHAFAFSTEAPGITLGPPRIPAGHKTTDQYFGEIETYLQPVTAVLPVTRAANAPTAAGIRIQYQGCAKAGLCYPPQTRVLDVTWTAAGGAAVGGGNANDPPAGGDFVSEQDRLAGLLAGGNLGWILASFFGLGLLLAFTPCMLPMIPILSGILVGSKGAAGMGRGLLLASVYVLAMAAAYTVFGVLAGLFGANLQALLQAPWVLVPFALLFVALAVAMFGLFDLQIATRWQSRLAMVGTQRGGVLGAAGMGFAAALIVGPCLAPPLAGALLYIGASGDALLGGAALFALGLGMGVPLLALGAFGGSILPKAGPWMEQVRVFFGVVLLGVAVWLLSRLLPGPVTMVLWALLLAGYALHLWTLAPWKTGKRGRVLLAKGAGVLGLVYAAVLVVGAVAGGANPLHPLGPILSLADTDGPADATPVFTRVDSLPDLRATLATAARAHQPVVLDFYADWCVECVHMERTVFAEPAVRSALQPVTTLQVDVTAYDAGDRQLMEALGVVGPPTMLFYAPSGQELERFRLVGAVDSDGFLQHLQQVFGG